MFDSGVGGLTVLHECLVSLPEEDFVYLGDTAMFPYGTRDPERLRERIRGIAELLLGRRRQAAGDRLQHGDLDRRGRGARGGGGARGRRRPGGRAAGRDRRGDHRQRPGRRAGDAQHGGERRLPAGAGGPGPRPRGDRGGGARPRSLHPGRLPVRRGRDGDGARLLRAAEARRGRHADPRLHPLPAGRADAAADPRPRRAPGQRRPRGRRRRAARRWSGAAWPARPDGEGAYRFLCTGEVDSFRELGTRFLQMPLGEVERIEPPAADYP